MYGTRLLRRLVDRLDSNWTAAERTAAEQGWELTRGRFGSVTVRDPRIRTRAIDRAAALDTGQRPVASSGRWAA